MPAPITDKMSSRAISFTLSTILISGWRKCGSTCRSSGNQPLGRFLGMGLSGCLSHDRFGLDLVQALQPKLYELGGGGEKNDLKHPACVGLVVHEKLSFSVVRMFH